MLLEGVDRMLPAVVEDAATLVEMAGHAAARLRERPFGTPGRGGHRDGETCCKHDNAAKRRGARPLSETRFNPDRLCEGSTTSCCAGGEGPKTQSNQAMSIFADPADKI